ncbi:AhpC/TSA antioxidant enzyme-domain-containing protein [Mycena amicta]|nr:AhpC/TSA antioxidant enzyme-domain-containing protein [Mycena amicta]
MSETLDQKTLEAACKFDVWDAKGDKVNFGSLFAEQKTIIVFIRHFFCGGCKMYVEDLSKVPEQALAAAGTKIILIGCGDWSAIAAYHEMTGYKGPIYADPSRRLYDHLDLVTTLKTTPRGALKPSYLRMSWLENFRFSIKTGYMAYPSLTFKAGKVSQNGGDFVLGPGVQCSFIHRMQNTEDHVEVVDLMHAAGVDYTPE